MEAPRLSVEQREARLSELISKQNPYKDLCGPNQLFNKLLSNLQNIVKTNNIYNVINTSTNEIIKVTEYTATVRNCKVKYSQTDDDIKHGYVEYYYPNNNLMLKFFLNKGIQTNDLHILNQDSTHKYTATFKNGILTNTVSIIQSENGIITQTTPYRNQQIHGIKVISKGNDFYRIHYENGYPIFMSQCVKVNDVVATNRFKVLTKNDVYLLYGIVETNCQCGKPLCGILTTSTLYNKVGLVNYIPGRVVQDNIQTISIIRRDYFFQNRILNNTPEVPTNDNASNNNPVNNTRNNVSNNNSVNNTRNNVSNNSSVNNTRNNVSNSNPVNNTRNNVSNNSSVNNTRINLPFPPRANLRARSIRSRNQNVATPVVPTPVVPTPTVPAINNTPSEMNNEILNEDENIAINILGLLSQNNSNQNNSDETQSRKRRRLD